MHLEGQARTAPEAVEAEVHGAGEAAPPLGAGQASAKQRVGGDDDQQHQQHQRADGHRDGDVDGVAGPHDAARG